MSNTHSELPTRNLPDLSSISKNIARVQKRSFTNGKTKRRFFNAKSPTKVNKLNPVSLNRPALPDSERSFLKMGRSKLVRAENKDRHINSSSNLIALVGGTSHAGFSDGIQKLNQDTYLVDSFELNNQEVCVIAVLDGHGFEGHRVSNFLRLNIKSN